MAKNPSCKNYPGYFRRVANIRQYSRYTELLRSVMFTDSFDSSAALAALVLWLVFNYLAMMLNCDLQRIILTNDVIRHVLGYIAFYFLFTALDSKSSSVPVYAVLLKTFLIYLLFILATKSKWPFAVVILGLLFADQVVKNHIAYLEAHEKEVPEGYRISRQSLFWSMVLVIFLGFLHYTWKQQQDHGADFSWYKLLLTHGNCKL